MPKAKYNKDADGFYFKNVPTGRMRKDGYPEYKKVRAKTIKALDEKLRQAEQLSALAVNPTNMTVDQWKEIWFSSYKSDLAPSTQNFYNNLYKKHISPRIGSLRMLDVKEVQCQSILTAMGKQNYAAKTVKAVRTTLYGLFDKARANRFIPFNPCDHLTATGAPKQPRRALTQQERADYLQTCKTHDFGTFAAFLYFFGLRRGEALALTGADIHPDKILISKQCTFPNNNQPHLSAPKTSAGVREIPIPTKARFFINFNNLPQGYIFADSTGNPLSYSEVRRRWHSFLQCAFPDGTDITEHYLRHNYCSMLFENEVDLLTVKTLAGHESVSTTLEIYTHYTEQMQRQAAAKILAIG